ncbi:hypothetical protein YC2023_079311 [Brassica napus]
MTMERAESGEEQQAKQRTRCRQPGARPTSRRNGCGAASKIGTESFSRTKKKTVTAKDSMIDVQEKICTQAR